MIDRLRRRKAAYQQTFPVENGEPVGPGAIVLADLARFTGIIRPALTVSPVTGQVDVHATVARAARAEVMMRIMAHVHIDDRALYNMREPADD